MRGKTKTVLMNQCYFPGVFLDFHSNNVSRESILTIGYSLSIHMSMYVHENYAELNENVTCFNKYYGD